MADAELGEVDRLVLEAIAQLDNPDPAPNAQNIATRAKLSFTETREALNRLQEAQLITPGLHLTEAGREALNR